MREARDVSADLLILSMQPMALLDRRAAVRLLGLGKAPGIALLDRMVRDGLLDLFLSPDPVSVILSALAASRLGLKLRPVGAGNPLHCRWVDESTEDLRETWSDDEAVPVSSFATKDSDGWDVVRNLSYSSPSHVDLRSYPRRSWFLGDSRPPRPRRLSAAARLGKKTIRRALR